MPKAKTRANGTGTAFKRGRTWTAEVVVGYKPDQNGIMRPIRRTKGGFRTKTDALNAIPEIKSSGLARKQNSIVTLDMLWRSFEKSSMQKLSKDKKTHYRTARKKIERIAHVDIALLTIDDLQDIVNKQAQTYYPAKDIKTLLSRLYKRAVAEQRVNSNLADFIVLPSVTEAETIPFTEQEIVMLWQEWQASHDCIVGCCLLMIYTGMMPGELMHLTVDMVDFEKQTITGAGLKTETRKAKPIILPDIILPVLRSLCVAVSKGKVMKLQENDFYRAFHDMITRLSLNDKLRPYSCRHTTATTLGKTDTPLFAIQDVLRHANITTTQRYVHLDTQPLISAANNIYAPEKAETKA